MMQTLCFLCLLSAANATGAHQHLLAFPQDATADTSQKSTIATLLKSAGKDLVLPDYHQTMVARSTHTQYMYELWHSQTPWVPNYDPEYYWATNPKDRVWTYVGDYSLLAILWLMGIGTAGAMWLEMMQFYNGYPNEEYFEGVTMHIRTWKDPCCWWMTRTMRHGYYSMWYTWHAIHLPWTKRRDCAPWTSKRCPMPTIPMYRPWVKGKKLAMILKGGADSLKEKIPSDYGLEIMRLWTNKHYDSYM